MTLASAWMLHFLWILPLAGFALIVQHRRHQRAMQRFAEPAILARLTPDVSKGRRFTKNILLLLALGILLLALAGPRWGSRYQEVTRKGVDIMIIVDVSRSMMVEDVKPNRLERARREIVDFLNIVEGDRVGLTIFAGSAFVQCPLTLDYAALEMFLNALQAGIIPVPGTDMGAAIETALTAFDAKTETDKVMLLITDGEDNEQQGLAAAREAARQGVKIFVFGIGEPSGGPVPAGGEQGGFTKDGDGKLVLSKLDEKTLQDLGSVTGGGYVRSTAGDLDLDLLYFEGIKQKTEAQTLKSGKIKVYEERFNIFILAGFLLLLIEDILDDRRRTATAKKFRLLFFFGVCFLSSLMQPGPLPAAETPDGLYRQGRFDEAQKAYAQGDMDHPKDIRYRYNRGCAAFQAGQYKEAEAAFSSVMKRTKDSRLQFKAAYNLGNTAFKQGDYSAAAEYYKQALSAYPQDEDARYNLELSLRAIEQMKQQPSTSPQVDPETGDNKKEGQEQEDTEKNGSPQNDGTQKRDPGKEDPPADDSGEKEKDVPPEETSASSESRNQEAADQKTEAGANDNLSGELKPLQAPPQLDPAGDEAKEARSATDKKRAEALLDNVQEDPAGILRFMVPENSRHDNPSRRDW